MSALNCGGGGCNFCQICVAMGTKGEKPNR